MKIVLIGYGKMGKTIEKLAPKYDCEISGIIRSTTSQSERIEMLEHADVAIEFTRPETAYENIMQALDCRLPIISGTTGWLDRLKEITEQVEITNGALLYASNFSIGVNVLFELNRHLAKIMNEIPEYVVSMTETHHIHKLDEPSGTAISLANDIIQYVDDLEEWSLHSDSGSILKIDAKREGEIFGIHEVNYESEIDKIKIYHEAKNRKGFAIGAITAAKWLKGRSGVYSMKDMLGFKA